MKKLITFIAFMVLVFMGGGAIQASTTVSGGIYTSTTWDSTGSPYIVTGSIVVFSAATLTIGPGVEVRFAHGMGMEVRGKLMAIGTAAHRVIFTSDDSVPTQNSYGSVKVTNTVGGTNVQLSYCSISYSAGFLNLSSSIGDIHVDHCNFYDNYYGIVDVPDYGTVTVDSSTFDSNYYGANDDRNEMHVTWSVFKNNRTGTSACMVSNSVFFGNTAVAVIPYISLQNCEIYNNGLGVDWDGHASTSMRNNYIHDNATGVEIRRLWNTAGIEFSGNKICSNTTWNIQYDFNLDVSIPSNCFCSTDSAVIRSKIRDGYVDTHYGVVGYDMSSACNAGPNDVPVVPTAGTKVIISPNPFSGQALIEFDYDGRHTYYFTIIDQLGRNVGMVDKIRSGKVELKGYDMVPGVYYYQLNDEQEVVSKGNFVVE